MSGPLHGIRVADFTRGIAGPHATKLLADYGATVTKLEPPGGDPARYWGPFKDDVPNPETSAPFLFFNTSKRSVVVDLQNPADRGLARRLILASDVVVEDYAPGELARFGLDLAALRAEHPSLVICSVTPFGQTGPYATMIATDVVLQAMGGAMYATGHVEREPLRLGGSYADWHAGLAAALAIVLAMQRAEATGEGEQIDLSVYETQAGGKDRRQLALLAHAYSGVVTRRHGTAHAICSGVRPCIDGYINLLGNGPRLPALLRMVGREDLAERPEVHGPEECIPADLAEEIEVAYLTWTTSHTMDEALEIAQQHRILGGTVHSIGDLLADPEFRTRGLWETIDHPATGPIEYPSRPFIMPDSPRLPARRAPMLGEHTAEVLADLPPRPPSLKGWGRTRAATVEQELPLPIGGLGGGAPARKGLGNRTGSPIPNNGGRGGRSARPAAPDPRLPLAGVRVIDLTVVWAGPFASQLLAEWGAEVIRPEPITAVQPQTRGVERAVHLTRELVELAVARGTMSAGYPDREPGSDPWNRGALFNASSSNKLSFTGNLLIPSVRAAFERLVAAADVLVENNVPSTAEKMGLSYERLSAINPQIVVVRMPGFGLSGRRANYRCWGNHLEGMAGHHIVRAYPDMTLDAVGETYACDSVAGLTAALAAVMALRHRARTGRGQQVEVPQIEAFAQMMGVEILDYTMNGRIAGAMGNDHRTHAPHGAYPCRTDPSPASLGWGDRLTGGSSEARADFPAPRAAGGGGRGVGSDRWIALDVGTEEQWQALCTVLGASALAADPRFVTMTSRWQHRRVLDAALGDLTRPWDRMELFHRLQAARVPAGPVQDDGDCFSCPHLAARGFFQEQTRADIGTHRYPGMLFQWLDTSNTHRRPPVTLGQDNDYVYRTLLGLSDEEYQHLVSEGEIGTTYPERLLRPSEA